MMTERKGIQLSLFSTNLEDVVPESHLLRQLEAAVDFSFIYDELRSYYCANNGKYSIDPVVVVKQLLIGFLYGIHSERRLETECTYNVAYRWFLGLSFEESIPDHSTISQLRRRKFGQADVFKKLFDHVLTLCVEAGLVSGKLLLTDSTHVKANASKTSKVKVEVERETVEYFKRLDAYEAEERKRLGMPTIERKTPEPKKKEQTKSITDPEAGWLQRPGKPDGFHYLSHQTLDAENGIILDVDVTPGNVPDNVPYEAQIGRCIDTLEGMDIKVQGVGADASYDTAMIHKGLDERNEKLDGHEIAVYMPVKEVADNTKVEFKKNDFAYDREKDEFICPNNARLSLKCLQRSESGIEREYRADAKTCKACPLKDKCLASSQKCRKLRINIFKDIVDKHHENYDSPEYCEAQNQRQIWCEGTFSSQKSQHNLRKLNRRGLKAATDHCLLSATVMNLKRLLKHHMKRSCAA